ncbi:MAG: DUF1905 domain-containing protein [Anaerolineae bacterium]|nr:DUF1905 domain-containing protein [Anaerolineae bacterium]
MARQGNKTVLPIPFDPDEVWGGKPRHHITGSINGHAVRGALDTDATQYVLSLGPAWCRDTGIGVGDQVEVQLAPEGPQFADLAPDIAAALAAAPVARAFYEGLATFYRKGYLRWVEGARKPETRAARIEELVSLLEAGVKQR